MATWIDFKELREKLRFVEVLQLYNVQLKIKGDRAVGVCPLPSHPSRSDNKPRTPSFSAHLGKGIWRCFGCNASGNCIDFGVRMQGLDPDDPVQFRKAALKLAEAFGISFNRDAGKRSSVQQDSELAVESREHPKCEASSRDGDKKDSLAGKPVQVNQPIDFELKSLDPDHAYLINRGFTSATIQHFGLGFCSRGLMKDRIAIPIHDARGRLVGYAGRLVDDSRIDDTHPRYLFPGPREREGVVHEFRKGMLVYNLHRLERPATDLLIVEGFASVWWLHQHGYSNVVALMGNSCSSEQAGQIAEALLDNGRVWLIPDGNDAGKQLASQALPLLARRHLTRWIELPDDQQPTDLPVEQLLQILSYRA